MASGNSTHIKPLRQKFESTFHFGKEIWLAQKDGGKALAMAAARGVDFYKRTVTTHFCSLLLGIRLGHFMSSCLFSFSFIGHILA